MEAATANPDDKKSDTSKYVEHDSLKKAEMFILVPMHEKLYVFEQSFDFINMVRDSFK